MWQLRNFFLFSCIIVAAKCTGSNNLRAVKDKVASPPLVCHITMVVTTEADATDGQTVQQHHHYECAPVQDEDSMVSDFSYTINLPQQFVEENQENLRGGNLFAKITGGQIVNAKVMVPSKADITVVPSPKWFETSRRQRRLDVVSGSRRLLVVRISATDATNSYTAQQLSQYIFNASKPYFKPSLASQFSLLSFGKFNLTQTSYGIVDVQVPLKAAGAAPADIRDAAVTAVQQKYSVASITSLAEHVIFCIPPGTGSWSGASTAKSWRIVLNDQWCGYLSGLMREMGVNLGLPSANVGTNLNTDFTSYMSAGFPIPFFPAKSFNGANNWDLGWYNDRSTTIDPSKSGQAVMLATFIDYNKSQKFYPVLIKIGENTFIQYNRAKGFNSGAQQMVDQVTVVQQLANGTNLLGGIDLKSPQVSIPNFDRSGRYLVIYVCSAGSGNENSPDWMLISIGFDKTFCNTGADFQPVPPPTPPPTASPTKRPTAVPTVKPTLPPTIKPTVAPVKPTPAPFKNIGFDVQTTKRPTSASATCYDTDAKFSTTGFGLQGCLWLAARANMQTQLCPQQAVKNACPRTCKVCTSTCNDSATGTFVETDEKGIVSKRDCVWLSLRTNKIVAYCPRKDVSALCPVTCKACQ